MNSTIRKSRITTLLQSSEPYFVAGYLVLFFCVALAVYTRSSPYTDEVMDAEMAINLVKGKGPVSFAHPQIEPGVPFVSAAPLYDYSLAAWLKMWGGSRAAVMSFNITIVSAATLLIWVCLLRSQMSADAGSRLLFVMAMPWIPAVIQVYGSNRYDSIGFLLLATACFMLTLGRSWVRRAMIFLCGLCLPFSSLHVALASAPLAILALLTIRRECKWEFFSFAAGGILGSLLFAGLLYSYDSFDPLIRVMEINNVDGPKNMAMIFLAPLKGGSPDIFRGGNLFLLLGLITILAGQNRYKGMFNRILLFGLLAGLTVPVVFTVAGRYSWTYAWLAALPMLAALCILMGRRELPRWIRLFSLGCIGIAVLSLAPMRILSTMLEWEETGNQSMYRFVEGAIEAGDVVYAAYTAYYPVKDSGNTAYFDWVIESMTPEQRSSINLCILNGDHFTGRRRYGLEDSVLDTLGGKWVLVDRFTVGRSALRMKIPPRPKDQNNFDLYVLRRKN